MMRVASIILILLHFCGIGLSHDVEYETVRIRRQDIQPLPYLLLYSFEESLTILRFNLDGTGYFLVNEQLINVSSPPTSQTLAIDYSYSSNRVYFSLGTKIGVAKLYEADQPASSLTLIDLNALNSVGDISYDWIKDMLYFIGTGNDIEGVYAYSTVSGSITQLRQFTTATNMSKICTAANHDYIFWNEGNVIMFGSSESMQFFTFETLPSSSSILDLFCDSSLQYLNVYLSDGTIHQFNYSLPVFRLVRVIDTLVDTEPLASQVIFPQNALKVSIFDNTMFFLISFSSNNNDGTYILRSIPSLGDIVNYPTSKFTNSFALVQPDLQPGTPAFTFPCSNEPCCSFNEDCSDLCFQVSSNSYVCGCSPDYTLTSSNECSLSPNTASFIYSYYEEAANGVNLGVVRSRSIDGQSSSPSLVQAQYMGIQTGKIEQLAISISNDELYFVENAAEVTLSRVSLSDPSVKSTILTLNDTFTIAVLRYDWLNDYLYWTDGSSILRMRPNVANSQIEVFLTANAIALAVDPLQDLICYSVVMSLSSSDIICVNSSLSEIFRLSVGYVVAALALDLEESRIYWGGRQQGFFMACLVYTSSDCIQIPYPSLPDSTDSNNSTFFIYIVEDRIIWLPTNYHSIINMDKQSGDDVIPFTISLPNDNLISVNALDVNVFFHQPGFGYLSCLIFTNGGCSHFCIPSSDGATFSCGCPNGYTFVSNTTCEFVVPETTAPPTQTATAIPCPEDYCFNGGMCTTSVVLGLQCICPFPYAGDFCQDVDQSFLSSDTPNTKIAIAVVIPIMIVIIVLIVATSIVLLIIFYRLRTSKITELVKKENIEQSAYENKEAENSSK